jgi:hypothetical protein
MRRARPRPDWRAARLTAGKAPRRRVIAHGAPTPHGAIALARARSATRRRSTRRQAL